MTLITGLGKRSSIEGQGLQRTAKDEGEQKGLAGWLKKTI
jgi:hypothetical protein